MYKDGMQTSVDQGSIMDTNTLDLLACRFVWLNQYADQFLPIVALVGLRVIVGLGDKLIKLVTKPKKDPMQVTSFNPIIMLLVATEHQLLRAEDLHSTVKWSLICLQ